MNIFKTRTFWTALATIVTGIGLIVAGEFPTGINAVMGGIVAIFMRDGIAKLQK